MQEFITTPIQKRFSDADMFRHINNAAQQLYFDLGKTDFLRQSLALTMPSAGAVSLVTVATANNYFRQIHFEDDIEVRTCVQALGNKSITLFQQIVSRQDGSTLSDSRTTMAVFDTARQTAVPLCEEWRTALQMYICR